MIVWVSEVSMKAKKFATQIDETVLKDLKSYATQTDRSISSVVNEAVAEYLQRAKVRPAFRDAIEEVLSDHSELLKRLAK
jgi:predicted transcriptional regulator